MIEQKKFTTDPLKQAGIESNDLTNNFLKLTLAYCSGEKKAFEDTLRLFRDDEAKRILEAIGNYIKPENLSAFEGKTEADIFGSDCVQKWIGKYLKSFVATSHGLKGYAGRRI